MWRHVFLPRMITDPSNNPSTFLEDRGFSVMVYPPSDKLSTPPVTSGSVPWSSRGQGCYSPWWGYFCRDLPSVTVVQHLTGWPETLGSKILNYTWLQDHNFKIRTLKSRSYGLSWRQAARSSGTVVSYLNTTRRHRPISPRLESWPPWKPQIAWMTWFSLLFESSSVLSRGLLACDAV
jgi:hypothetical protein